MLIHTTTETAVHEAFKGPLLQLRSEVLRKLEAHDDRLLGRLRTTWERETALVPAIDLGVQKVPFDRVLQHLRSVVRETRVVIDNYRSTDRLNYESGPVTAIAVGGNTLSRGLTLEGLVSSLFVRAVSAYDTLLQMGRWFGYRDHYADLPRIWMTEELADWFRHLATVEAEMRQDINRYMNNPAENPLTFAVRLRSHPKMSITTKAKMKSAVKATAAYGGQLVESRFFDVGSDGHQWLAANARAARAMVAAAEKDGVVEPEPRDECVLFTQVPYRDVLEFLRSYSFHEKSSDGDRNRLATYIAKRVRQNSLLRWSVGIIGNSKPGADTNRCDLGSGVKVRMVKRSRLGQKSDTTFDGVADIKTLTSRRDETIDLAADGSRELPRNQILELRREQRPDECLLLIYPIEPASDTGRGGRLPLNAPTDDVVIGVALVFPNPRPGTEDSDVEYWSADLSDVAVEEEDVSVLDQDDDVA
jgi:hypothetical protein